MVTSAGLLLQAKICPKREMGSGILTTLANHAISLPVNAKLAYGCNKWMDPLKVHDMKHSSISLSLDWASLPIIFQFLLLNCLLSSFKAFHRTVVAISMDQQVLGASLPHEMPKKIFPLKWNPLYLFMATNVEKGHTSFHLTSCDCF